MVPRAYDYFGQPVGSHENDEGQIYIEPQGMCIMAGIGLADGRAPRRRWPRSRERLATPHGIVLHSRPTRTITSSWARSSTYPPGYKENAGIFCHTNPWIMIAEALAGQRRPRARLLPAHQPLGARGDRDVHRCEPYVYAQMIAGPGRADPRRGQELVADRHGRLELRRHHPVDPGHPARARRPADRSPPAGGRRGASGRRADSAAPRTASPSTEARIRAPARPG